MPLASPTNALHGSPLVRVLSELAGSGSQDTARHFSQRLGSLIDLADSIKLATAQLKLRDLPFRPDVASAAGVRREFLARREAIIKSILRSCLPGTSTTRIRFPLVDEAMPVGEATAAAPFLSFYSAQQGEIDFKVRGLQAQVRKDISGISPGLARLAALDGALFDAMGGHTRRYFSVVPELLAQRFEELLAQYREQVGDGQYDYTLWQAQLQRLRGEIQRLLLAESETRLLPVLGLIEALDDIKD